MENTTILWLVVAIASGVIEILTLGLTTIWFAAGAIIALIFAEFNTHLIVQILAFLISSSVLLYYTRPIAQKYLKIGHTKTNVKTLIGKTGIVIKEIDSLQGTGQVKITGQIWSAKTLQGEKIPEGSKVEVLDIQGVKLVVKQID